MAAVIAAPTVAIFTADGSTGLGVLRALTSLTISDVFCDLGSLRLILPKDVEGAEHLLVDADRQVRVRMAGCPDMWFLADEESLTYISDDPESEDVEVTMRSLAGVLDEAKVLPSAGVGSTAAEWAFDAVAPGAIISALFSAAQTLGFLEGVTLAGGGSTDTAGVGWPDTHTATFKAGTSLLDVLKSLTDLGLLEWRMNARVLELHRIGGSLDRTLTVPLRPREDITSAPYQRSKRAIATHVLVEGADGETVLRSQSLTSRRRRLAYVSQTSAPADSIAAVGDLYLAAHAAPDVQMTHEVTDGPTTPVPWRDYRPGDRLPTLAGGDGVTVQRCAQIALEFDPGGTKTTLELGSVLATAEEYFDRQLRKLLPGDQ